MKTRWWMLSILALSCWSGTEGCSCMPSHPQAQYCQADFVIVAKVQRVFTPRNEFADTVYKVRIRKVLKETPKAHEALKKERIRAPSDQGMCGVNFKPGEMYLITGKVHQLHAYTNLCSYNEKWRLVTPRQRKGFRMLYKQGCMCKVQVSPWYTKGRVSPHTCVSRWDDCFERHGICMPTNAGRCRWARVPKLTKCLETYKHNGTMT